MSYEPTCYAKSLTVFHLATCVLKVTRYSYFDEKPKIKIIVIVLHQINDKEERKGIWYLAAFSTTNNFFQGTLEMEIKIDVKFE